MVRPGTTLGTPLTDLLGGTEASHRKLLTGSAGWTRIGGAIWALLMLGTPGRFELPLGRDVYTTSAHPRAACALSRFAYTGPSSGSDRPEVTGVSRVRPGITDCRSASVPVDASRLAMRPSGLPFRRA